MRRGPFSSSRREGPQYASRPFAPEERKKELWEYLVPESEKQDPYFDYSTVFEMFRPGAKRSAPPPPPPPPQREYQTRESPFQSQRGEARLPARGPGQPPAVDPAHWFDMGRVWAAITTLRQDPRFRRGSPVAVVRLAPEAEADRFFGVQSHELAAFLDELIYAINYAKPQDFHGRVLFQSGKDRFLWLAYTE